MRIRHWMAGAIALGLSAPLVGGTSGCAGEERRSDTAISQDLTQRLRGDPALATSSVQATSVEGRVTLRGVVRTDDARERAEDIAEEIPGVKDVSNQLEVSSAARTDPPAVGSPPPSPPAPSQEGTERPADEMR